MRLRSEDAEEWAEKLEKESPEVVLRWALSRFHPRMALSNSFQLEDVVVLGMAVKVAEELGIPAGELGVFTLDTGRLHQETYEMMERVRGRYKLRLNILVPDGRAVREMVESKGPNLFYESVDNRHQCCDVRKVQPLKAHLAGLDAWVTGLRRDQWASRTDIKKVEINETNGGIVKLNPIADWTWERLEAAASELGVPKHPLYSSGFSSIGCLPCTRATQPGEDPRAGRWWWEDAEKKECGLHVDPKTGRLRRAAEG
jgi:thioredoxin-dependent adenylylsulfate APS reductase